jgi:hypothetical protein
MPRLRRGGRRKGAGVCPNQIAIFVLFAAFCKNISEFFCHAGQNLPKEQVKPRPMKTKILQKTIPGHTRKMVSVNSVPQSRRSC